MSVEAQAEVAGAFVGGIVRCFGLEAEVASTVVDDAIEVRVDGQGLGRLVGPRGVTIEAIQELTRTVTQRRSDEHTGRIHVDVGGYRARRADALQAFARRVAAQVLETGQANALEPMSAADRKVVHDAVAELAGVLTSSEGEDPRRYVVIRPVEASTDGDAAESASSEELVSEPPNEGDD